MTAFCVLSATPDTDAAAVRRGLLMEEDLLDSPALTLGFFLLHLGFFFFLFLSILTRSKTECKSCQKY